MANLFWIPLSSILYFFYICSFVHAYVRACVHIPHSYGAHFLKRPQSCALRDVHNKMSSESCFQPLGGSLSSPLLHGSWRSGNLHARGMPTGERPRKSNSNHLTRYFHVLSKQLFQNQIPHPLLFSIICFKNKTKQEKKSSVYLAYRLHALVWCSSKRYCFEVEAMSSYIRFTRRLILLPCRPMSVLSFPPSFPTPSHSIAPFFPAAQSPYIKARPTGAESTLWCGWSCCMSVLAWHVYTYIYIYLF